MATEIRPQPKQVEFLASPADIVFYGGSAGAGKSFSLIVEPLRHVRNPQFGAMIFRRTFPQITLTGGLWEEAGRIYAQLGGVPNVGELFYRFPAGSTVRFSHMQYESNKINYAGAQIPLISFDQVEQFSANMFWFMLSRNRSTCGVRPYIRATCNPDPDSFVAELIDWWIDEDGWPISERSGQLRWFYRLNDETLWYDSTEQAMAAHPDLAAIAPPKSFTFISASVYDNQALLKADPGYLANLMSLSHVDKLRLLGDKHRGGNWKIRPEAGKVFNRSWFEIVPAAPAGGEECIYWDFAGTKKSLESDDPDYTAGVDIRLVNGIYYVMNCVAAQESPTESERLFKNTSMQAAELAWRTGVPRSNFRVRFELEPGSAALRDAQRLVGMLAGLDVAATRNTGDKISRAKALAAQAEAGNVKLVAGDWNETWLKHMHSQPAKHDDIMDGSSGAFNELSFGANYIGND